MKTIVIQKTKYSQLFDINMMAVDFIMFDPDQNAKHYFVVQFQKGAWNKVSCNFINVKY